MNDFITNFLLPVFAIITGVFLYILTNSKQKKKKLNQKLTPFYTIADIEYATTNYVQTKGQLTNPLDRNNKDSVKFELITYFLKKVFWSNNPDSRVFLILGEPGSGKTTFLINLYAKYSNSNRSEHNIFLIPLSYPHALSDIREIEEPQSSILLLDGFDEDIEAIKSPLIRFNEILKETWKFKNVLITSRVQIFPNKETEPEYTYNINLRESSGYHKIQKIYISPFDMSDIKQYINLNQNLDSQILNKIYNQLPRISKSPLLLNLLINSYHNQDKNSNTDVSVTSLYEAYIDSILTREAMKSIGDFETSKKRLYELNKEIAYKIFVSNKAYISHHELTDFVENQKLGLSTTEVISRSLLSRDSTGNYQFKHVSIFEYFMALYAYENLMTGKIIPDDLPDSVKEIIEEFIKDKKEKTRQNNA
ncbi:NACHT domain-containing protein [Flavobacteriaceae bacterium M23B6Z8]